MKRSSLGMRLAVYSLLAVSAISALFFAVAWRIVSVRVHSEAAQEATRQSGYTISQLTTIDQLSRGQVESSMRLLQDQGLSKGSPSLKGTATVAGKTVPDLHLGTESQVLNFAMVDHIKKLAGGTATLFVWDGSNFIRVTTNVQKPDGSRAVGTVLDPKGKAFAALGRGQSFTGVVDILGIPYMTSYSPMNDADGKLVGAWYTGYRLDSIATLGKSIGSAKILDHGFVALLKPSGEVVFHSSHVTSDALDSMRKHADKLVMQEDSYPAWGYTVLTAYPKSDVTKRLFEATGMLVAGIVILVGSIVLLQFFLLDRQVLRPVCHLAKRMAEADLNTLLNAERKDEIGTLASSFNQFVMRLRETLLQVRDGSAASTAKSGEIRGISTTTVACMKEQLQCAEDASAAVAQLTSNIASTSSHTEEASGRAREAAEAARKGGQMVASAAIMIQGLAQETQQSAMRIDSLSERTRQIGSIVEVIQEIAAGTNLLALNASIEAARAGEHGRGFAVVAGEVRRLAERTAQATQQVSTLVSGIEEETGLAATGIRSACEHATEGAETVSCLNTTFEQISRMVIEVDGQIDRIAHATGEENTAANAVNQTMQMVALRAKESAGGAGQVVAASGELLGIAHTLEEMVQRFNMSELHPDYVEKALAGAKSASGCGC